MIGIKRLAVKSQLELRYLIIKGILIEDKWVQEANRKRIYNSLTKLRKEFSLLLKEPVILDSKQFDTLPNLLEGGGLNEFPLNSLLDDESVLF